MRKWIEWFAENTVAANLLLLVVVAGGLLSLFSLRQEIIPEIDAAMVTVTIPYPGASPSEVQQSTCVQVEERVQGLSGIKRVTSIASEGAGTVIIQLMTDADGTKLLGDIKSEVDAIDSFPKDVEKPIVQKLSLERQVLSVVVAGQAEEHVLKEFGERIRDEIGAINGITKVEISATRPYEISVEIDETQLRKYDLTFDEVAAAIRASSLDVPGGTIRAKGGQVLLRSLGQAYEGKDFENIVLRTRTSGARLLLKDVARIRDGFAETDTRSIFDGKPAVFVDVYRTGNQSAITIAELVREFLAKKRPQLPEGMTLEIARDDVRFLEGRIDLLVRNGQAGFLLVLISLALFLRLRLALWVSLGVPISFLGAFCLLPTLGVSINMIALFGFIIVLGIVVDDATLIGENVYSHMQKGKSALQAAKDGAAEVATPVTFAVLTTIAAFSVLLGIEGTMGQFSRSIPLVVIACLSFSLIEAFFILPAHLRHLKTEEKKPRGMGRLWLAFQNIFTGGLQLWIHKVYLPSLELFLRWRYATIAVSLGTLLVSIGLVINGAIKFRFLPHVESDIIAADITMPRGTPKQQTERAVTKISKSIEQVAREVDGGLNYGEGSIRHVLQSIGTQPFLTAQRQNMGATASPLSSAHLGEVMVELAPAEERDISSSDIVARWRELTGPIPGAVEVAFTSSLMSSNKPINIELTAPDYETIKKASASLKQSLASIVGVIDISDDVRIGKEELVLRMRPDAQATGLRQSDLARQVRQAYYGEEAQRIQRGRDDVRVMVRYPESERQTLASIEELRVRKPSGQAVPLSSVAEISWDRGLAEIKRAKRRRAITITANVDREKISPDQVMDALKSKQLPELARRFPGLQYGFEGQQREQSEFIGAMKTRALLAMLLIFALLAVPLRSYLQPLIIMSVIPFGIVGAIWGHWLLGMDITMMSLIGLIALTGVVVNDSLVVVDFVNRKRRNGIDLHRAVWEAGRDRFRAILLTSLTTFAGLTPLLFEKSVQAHFLIPAAASLAFGVVFATVITLVMVPCLYLVLEDLRIVGARLHRGVRGIARCYGLIADDSSVTEPRQP
ncbi:MAG: acriflavin resistance protein [Planctomycetota bacterium]|nr:MAG: acriflavin resistance protein [Planctomycetota bacterium]